MDPTPKKGDGTAKTAINKERRDQTIYADVDVCFFMFDDNNASEVMVCGQRVKVKTSNLPGGESSFFIVLGCV